MDAAKLDAAAARAILEDGNRAWGKARVALDRPGLERMMAREFFVHLRGRRLTRQEFLDLVSASPAGARLVRFDPSVLTVAPSEQGWVGMILERLEYLHTEPGGGTRRECVLAITRDGWIHEAGRWVVQYSELIGEQRWTGDGPPPFPCW